jgi:drug/metabolite transporter (DMT)-like permease
VFLALGKPAPVAPWSAWLSFGYVAVVSQFLGFFAWYRGLALGGVTRVSQLLLLQPCLTLAFAALLTGEHLGWREIGFTALIVLVVGLSRRMTIRHKSAG